MKEVVIKYKMFFKYMLVSLFVSAINVVIYAILVNISKGNHIFSNIIAWIASTYVNFEFNKKIVFKNEENQSRLKQMSSFYVMRLTSLVIDTLVLKLCIEVFLMHYIIAKIISNFSTTFNNYFISKYYIFNKKKEENQSI